MKKGLIFSTLIFMAAAMFVACDTEPEPIEVQSTKVQWKMKDAQYYENLRAWKATRPEFGFGWFSALTGEASLQGSMRSIPDSIGIISIWGGFDPVNNPIHAEEMRFHQETCGTKVIMCHLIESWFPETEPVDGKTREEMMAERWGWEGEFRPSNRFVAVTPAQEAAIRKYAKYLVDQALEMGLDGIDIDHEPNVGGGTKPYILGGYWNRMIVFIDELGKFFGPKANNGTILAIDGEYYSYIDQSLGEYFDYFISQAYNTSSYTGLDSRASTLFSTFPGIEKAELAKRFIVAENFESYATNGGNVNYRNRQGIGMASSLGMADWHPMVDGKEVRKGGAGTYHMEYEFNIFKDYRFLREMIWRMAQPLETDGD